MGFSFLFCNAISRKIRLNIKLTQMPGFLQQREMNKLNIFCIVMNLKALFNQFIRRSLRVGSIKIFSVKTTNIKKIILLKF